MSIPYYYYLLYGALQGVLEFLPVSSSGNFSLLRTFFVKPLEEIPLSMEWVLHGASLGAVLFVLKRELFLMGKSAYIQALQPGGGFIELSNRPAVKYFLFLIISTIPSIYVGKTWMNSPLEVSFGLSKYCFQLGISFVITSSVLWSSFFFAKTTTQSVVEKSWFFPLIVGVAQAIAVGGSGISRSGLCLSACLWMGVPHPAAFRYTFFLAIPLYLGAFLKGSLYNGSDWENMNREMFFWVTGSFILCFFISLISLQIVKIIWDKKANWLLAACAIYTSFLAATVIAQAYLTTISA